MQPRLDVAVANYYYGRPLLLVVVVVVVPRPLRLLLPRRRMDSGPASMRRLHHCKHLHNATSYLFGGKPRRRGAIAPRPDGRDIESARPVVTDDDLRHHRRCYPHCHRRRWMLLNDTTRCSRRWPCCNSHRRSGSLRWRGEWLGWRLLLLLSSSLPSRYYLFVDGE